MNALEFGKIVDYEGAIDFSTLPHATEQINDCNTIIINGVNVFHNISADSTLGEVKFSWASTPTRNTVDGSFVNMDDIDVMLVYYLTINFKYLNAEDFVSLRKLLLQRHFNVTFFSKDDMDFVTREMYLDDKGISRLYMFDEKWVGVFDYKINLIGTNRDLTEATSKNPRDWTWGNDMKLSFSNMDILANLQGEGQIDDITATYSEQAKLSYGNEIAPPTGYYIAYWYTVDGGRVTGKYGLGQPITVWQGNTFYPKYERGI